MSSRTSRVKWQLVLLAAARLATIYAVAAALLVLPIFLWNGGPPQSVRDLKEYLAPIAIGFGTAFVLLTVARRAGFVALWLALAALWTWILRESIARPTDIVTAFVSWSALAIPLAFLGGLGVPATLRLSVGRWKPSAALVATLLWATLLAPAVALFVLPDFQLHPLRYAAIARLAGEVAWFVWAPGALLITVLSVAHVWVGTAPMKTASAAA